MQIYVVEDVIGNVKLGRKLYYYYWQRCTLDISYIFYLEIFYKFVKCSYEL